MRILNWNDAVSASTLEGGSVKKRGVCVSVHSPIFLCSLPVMFSSYWAISFASKEWSWSWIGCFWMASIWTSPCYQNHIRTKWAFEYHLETFTTIDENARHCRHQRVWGKTQPLDNSRVLWSAITDLHFVAIAQVKQNQHNTYVFVFFSANTTRRCSRVIQA
jgi:hypothetical protein